LGSLILGLWSSGTASTEKVFGFLIAAIAVQLILDGLASVGVIAPVKH
jgi:small neutral amino acid transporter SnatA (MarC family)